MKLDNSFPIIFFLVISLNILNTAAQNTLNINVDLKANSVPIKIKRKGMSAIGKYEFDNYKLVSGKMGWTSSKSNTTFRSNTNMSSKNKSSFVFVKNLQDSVIVNTVLTTAAEILTDSIITVNAVSDVVTVDVKNNFFNRTFFKWSGRTLTQGSERYLANFSFVKDSSYWTLLMVSPIAVEVDGNYQIDTLTEFNAGLSDGETDIEIKKINEIEGTKFSLLRGPALGYEFYLNDKPIAALQYHVMSMDRLFIWFHNDLDESLKFVIATAATSLLVKQY